MKKIFLALLIVATLGMQAQELKWHTTVKDAVEASKTTKKPILLFFTGSDWCGWCIRLQKEVLLTPEFSAWAKKNVVLLELDYPQRTPQKPEIQQQNAELQRIFGIQGYPTVFYSNVEVDKEGKINFKAIGKTGYVAGGPVAWLAESNNILKNK
jgi:protein disulfide-isomerase